MVSLRGVVKDFDRGVRIVEGLDLEVPAGAFVSFLGPSGSGKTTVLRLIAGLIEPTAGTVEVQGKAPAEGRDRMAYIFQEATLLPWLNVRENIAVPLRLREFSPRERREQAVALASWVGLEKVLEYYPRQLSGGMQMRVSIARAMSLKPDLLLLDEPFAALDEINRFRLNEEILAIRDTHAYTAVFVTHSVAEAVFLSDRVYLLAPNPARIVEEIEVPFPYPREPSLRETPAFQGQVAVVSRRLRENASTAA